VIRLALAALAAMAVLAVGCGDDNDGGESNASGTVSTEGAMTGKSDGEAMKDEKMEKDGAAMEKDGAAMEKDGAAMSAKRGALVDSQYGRVIADGKGEAFYLYDKEDTRRSECYGACATAWPPVLTKGRPRAGKGARRGLLGTTRRRNGKLQVTYAGHPLYYYKDDAPGTILCHDVDEFGGAWLVLRRSGKAVG
jgi:predicted lipoprotein with Yx(FWY)xxD motif